MQFQTIVMALAVSAAASPFTQFAARQGDSLVTYDCNDYLSACEKEDPSSSICQSRYTACEGCATQEHSCRVGAGPTGYSAQLNCTVAAQTCYQNATSVGTVSGAYGCQQARDTCDTAPEANHSFCASQYSGCQSCADAENKCRTAPDANEAYCSAQAEECYDKAIDL